jgi:hypothetical protein
MVQFWQEVPQPYFTVMSCRETARVVGEWDTVFYQALVNAFLPDLLGPVDKGASLNVFFFF